MTVSMNHIDAADDVLIWCGAIEVEHTSEGSRGWRLPRSRIDRFPSPDLVARARMQAGIRVVLGTSATNLSGQLAIIDVGKVDEVKVDLVIDGELIATAPVIDGSFGFDGIPAGDKVIELWLPQLGEVRLRGLEVPDDARVWRPELPRRRRIVTYGSSITQCGAAGSPARTWPALVARELDLDLTCLGYGGQCHLDPLIAREIGALSPDVITACLGINIYGQGTFNARSFIPAILGFIATIRDTCPDVPIVVISPIGSPSRETTANVVGFTLSEMRDQVARSAQLLRDHGDPNLTYVDGLDVLPLSQAERLYDGLHPDARGYEMMAEAIVPVVKELVAAPVVS